MQIDLKNQLDELKAREESQPWLLSYSDMVTLLLAFFVLFFAISQIDQTKFEAIMHYFNSKESMPLQLLEQKFEALIKSNDLDKSVDIQLTPDGLLINFQDNILFESGKADLNERAFGVLSAFGKILTEPEVSERKIEVQGHTDSVPLAKNAGFPSNWELSSARSSSVIRYLISHGIQPARFVSMGFADTRPLEQETIEVRGLQINRRVSLLIK